MIKRDLGREGEDAFSGWCNNAGFSCNPSANDKYGWDFIVEFPTEVVEGTPIDSLPPPIECKVQVKSTQGDRRGEQIKVSALYRLVKYGNPAFVCFIEYGSGHLPKGAYLVHIDETLIGKVLKRVRELEAKGKGDKLHNSKITVKYTDDDSIESLDGMGVKNSIANFIPDGMDQYVDQKRAHLNNLGSPGFKLNTTFDADDMDDFIDVSLGLKESVKVKDVKAFSSRFNIDFPDKEKSSCDGAILSMPNIKPTFTHKLVFKDSEYSSGIEFDADVYVSAINEYIPDDEKKVRISSDIVEIISKGKAVEVSFKFNFDEIVSLSVFIKRISVLEMIKNTSNIIYEVKDFNNNCIFSNELNTDTSDFKMPYDVFRALKRIGSIANSFNLDNDLVLINLGSIIKHADNIEKLYALVESRASDFELDVLSGDIFESSEKWAIILSHTAMIGNHAVGLILSFKSSKDDSEKVDIIKDIFRKYSGLYENLKNVPFSAQVRDYEKALILDDFNVKYLQLSIQNS